MNDSNRNISEKECTHNKISHEYHYPHGHRMNIWKCDTCNQTFLPQFKYYTPVPNTLLESLANDYNHPWPDEDKKTAEYRKSKLIEILTFIPQPTPAQIKSQITELLPDILNNRTQINKLLNQLEQLTIAQKNAGDPTS